jgi:hypothetical protein
VVASVVTDVAKRLWLLLAYGQRLIGVVLERSLVETPASRSNARRSERSFGSESSIKSSIPTAYWSFCKLLQQEKLRFARLLQSPLPDSNRRPPPYHGGSRIRAQFVEARQLGRGSRHGQTMRGNGAAAQAYSRGTSRAAGQVLVKHLASAGIAEIQRYLHEVVRSTSDGHGATGRAAAKFRKRVESLHSLHFEWPPGGVQGSRAETKARDLARSRPAVTPSYFQLTHSFARRGGPDRMGTLNGRLVPELSSD